MEQVTVGEVVISKYTLWANNKTKGKYVVLGICTNTTNCTKKQTMILYASARKPKELYVREACEFKNKFTRRMSDVL